MERTCLCRFRIKHCPSRMLDPIRHQWRQLRGDYRHADDGDDEERSRWLTATLQKTTLCRAWRRSARAACGRPVPTGRRSPGSTARDRALPAAPVPDCRRARSAARLRASDRVESGRPRRARRSRSCGGLVTSSTYARRVVLATRASESHPRTLSASAKPRAEELGDPEPGGREPRCRRKALAGRWKMTKGRGADKARVGAVDLACAQSRRHRDTRRSEGRMPTSAAP